MSMLTERSRNQKMVLDGEKDARFFEGQLEDFQAWVLAAYKKKTQGYSYDLCQGKFPIFFP